MPDKLDVEGLLKESKAEYKRLGNSGLKVSVPIMGLMSIGSSKWQPWVIEEEESLPLLKAAYDRGLTTWDTGTFLRNGNLHTVANAAKANVYSNGVSEELVGKAIKKYDLPREKLVILTKCFGYVGEDPGLRTVQYGNELPQLKDYVNQGGLSRQAIFNAVNASLKRLDLEYIDLLQIHRFDPNTPLEETMEALHDLVKSGKVRYIGASSMWAVQFAQLQFAAEKNGWTKFISMQNHYNLLYREEEREMNRFCNDTGVGLIPVCTLCSHILHIRIPDTLRSGHLCAVVTSPVLLPPSVAPPAQKASRKLATRVPATPSSTRRSLAVLRRLQRSMIGR
jgi:aryl-alcohol dehydrogenase-like predicted oxidoreductase